MMSIDCKAKKQCFLRVRCGVQNVSSTRSGQTRLGYIAAHCLKKQFCSRELFGQVILNMRISLATCFRNLAETLHRFLLDFFENLPPRCLGASFMVNSLTHDDFIPRGCGCGLGQSNCVILSCRANWSGASCNFAQTRTHFNKF